jgi:signal transduction histidine kinase
LLLGVDAERATALTRVSAGIAMPLYLATGGLNLPWPPMLTAALIGADVYAAAMLIAVFASPVFQRNQLALRAMTVLDNAIILGLMALTGGVISPLLVVLFLVVVTDAARYGAGPAVKAAIADVVAICVMATTVSHGSLSSADEVREVAWAAWLLIGGAALAGLIARARNAARLELAMAESRAALRVTEAELERDAHEQAVALAESRRDFLRALAHDFRTPVVAAAALADALTQTTKPLSEDQREEVGALLVAHTQHISGILEEVRAVADAYSTGIAGPDEPRYVPLLALLRQVATSGQGRPLSIECPADLHVRVSPHHLRRILDNLVDNACRHGGRETVTLNAAVHQGRVVIDVLDRGPGIPDGDLSRVLQKGIGLGHNRGTSGLGLWIVSELAAGMGATFKVQNRDGGGLSVSLTWPTTDAVHPL